MRRIPGTAAVWWLALAASCGCSEDTAVRRGGTGGSDSGLPTSPDAQAGAAGKGGSSASGGASTGGAAGAASGGTGGNASGGTAGTGGSAGSGGSLGPPIRGSTTTPCLAHSDCPSGMCIGGLCDAPGCGPTPGLTEVCDELDNDCDAIADNTGTCGESCVGAIYEGHAYMFCRQRLAFYDAEALCISKGMHLVRMDSDAERDFVRSTMLRFQSGSWPWIGATDRSNTGVWRWLDGTVFWRGGADGTAEGGAYTSWSTGQPSDGGQDHAQRCVQLVSGGWNDLACAIREEFVCEVYNFAPGCSDAVKNGTETGIDCGGSCGPCPAGEPCSGNAACQSGSCVSGTCADTCSDNVKNGTETDVDCGGACWRCAANKTCATNDDCGSRVCQGGTCAACVDTACPQCDEGYDCCTYSGACGCHGLLSQSCGGGPRP
jgi:hypothetical protein